jgi:hypothetical protein
MTRVQLRRHAPEAETATTCTVCGTTAPARITDHILVGTPGTPSRDGGVCATCGQVLNQVVDKFGEHLDVQVEQAQRQASDREITRPGPARGDPAR